MSGLVGVYIGYSCLGLAGILSLYQIRQWWIPWFKKSTDQKSIPLDTIQLIQELYNQLDSIDIKEDYNLASIKDAKSRINKWKDKTRTMLYKLCGQVELDNFNDKIKYIEERNEYINPKIGRIQAFYNEKELYLNSVLSG